MPTPATLVMSPVAMLSRNTMSRLSSAMNMLPARSIASPDGLISWVAFATITPLMPPANVSMFMLVGTRGALPGDGELLGVTDAVGVVLDEGVWLAVLLGVAVADAVALGVMATSRRRRALPASATNTTPAAPTASPAGDDTLALAACPPSPLKPADPVPATTVSTSADSRKTRWLSLWAYSRSPVP